MPTDDESADSQQESEQEPPDREQPAAQSDDAPADSDQSAEQPAEATDQAVDQAEEQAAGESDQPADQAEEQAAGESDQPADQAEEQPADSDQPTEQSDERPAEQSGDQPADSNQPAEQSEEQPAEHSGDQPAASASVPAAPGGTQAGRYIATLFSFDLEPGEEIGARIVRCCEAALKDGPMGERERHDFYRDFIACNQEVSQAKAEALTGVRTSCAMFVRAVRQWCGAPASGPYIQGTAMFKSMGNMSLAHPAFVPNDGTKKPNPGNYFYIASSKQSNDGHTGIFIEEIADGTWRTAEGGGGDGTRCRFTERKFSGSKFDGERRTLWGWFDCTAVGLPSS